MKTILLELENLPRFASPISICLGNFDGVHIGHQQVIKKAVLDSGTEVAVLTFDAPLGSVIDGRKAKQVLTSVSDRFQIITASARTIFSSFISTKNCLACQPRILSSKS